ncbi:glycoside hydrolase family 128 protein [Stemphylium lycopersici]|uniref:Glycoside hydrolase family 128 protein n=1 Tax=Stemphylium lycopersici TaxID=183478 RepID=A0A364MUQ6_STELY|nr:glycoside hydrolase family 128 protein [Stemphylium lycopersici]RAR04143.1 glycoside hydrolase family 128 protein [Stemphylium lycopersici]RAR11915.1 glycoside hydrolase family 128 protein [Stemphylium lycopersici]
MRRFTLLSATTALLTTTTTTAQSTASTSPKRGLCHVPSDDHPSDDKIWQTGPSPPTWYYNYQYEPSSAFSGDDSMQFVPMLWGASASDTGTPFLDSVKKQISSGANISYVLGFNEPDGGHSTGGSNLAASLAAARWKAEIEPLKDLGVALGAPGVTGAESGWEWLDNFFNECDGGCNPDFIPVHWYGNFEGMMSHIGRVTSKWPNMTVWVTEYGFPNQDLEATQSFYNMSASSFDSWPNITHYSYFGAFRSDVSNVGANAAMLTQDGELTDIGSWYMGGAATNNVPEDSSAAPVGIVAAKGYFAFVVAVAVGLFWV